MSLEVKINREIREYTESMFFGLSFRQFLFSVCACGVAVLIYILLRPYFSLETVSWVCILAAFPFAVIGFVKYNGMTAEKFIFAYLKSEFLIPKKLTFQNTNLYWRMFEERDREQKKQKRRIFRRKGRKKSYDKNTKKNRKRR